VTDGRRTSSRASSTTDQFSMFRSLLNFFLSLTFSGYATARSRGASGAQTVRLQHFLNIRWLRRRTLRQLGRIHQGRGRLEEP
jgi:hypothetical protein